LLEFNLSKLAREDLFEIADYTLDTWGFDQAGRYVDGLAGCFSRLAQNPEMGRPCDRIRRGYRRFEHEKHVIIYKKDSGGVFISRIPHQRMLPRKHMIEDPSSH
jgi:toxin ParE1/3/4